MFAKINNGVVEKFPYTVGQLRRDYPNTSFPKHVPESVMADFGMVTVAENPTPTFDPETHCIDSGTMPTKVGASWVFTPAIRALTTQELADRIASLAASIRSQRDSLLAATDWMALSDVTLSAEMATYRQALRDITAQAGFPHSVIWPVKPE
jgi:hypothetical protein